MGKVKVGEFEFESLKDAQLYAETFKKNPPKEPSTSTVPASEDTAAGELAEDVSNVLSEKTESTIGEQPTTDETSVNDGFVPSHNEDNDTQTSDAASSEALEQTGSDAVLSVDGKEVTPVESNTVVVETGLEFETKELTDEEKFDKEIADLESVDHLASNPSLKEVHGQD